MATFIETKDVKIFIDPGVSLAPRRYGLPPHPIERDEMEKAWRDIVYYASRSDIIIITHYHFDHFNPKRDLEDIYGGKDIYIKDYQNYINPSQIRRSNYFLHKLDEAGLRNNVVVADGKVLRYGDTVIEFSYPFPHGVDERLGYVIMVYIEDEYNSVLYTSDVEGPSSVDATEYIIGKDPEILVLDGPPTYLINRFGGDAMEDAIANINRITLFTDNLKELIIDHHFMRDKEYSLWRDKILNTIPSRIIKVMSVAMYMGYRERLLEAYRDRLYEEYPVN